MTKIVRIGRDGNAQPLEPAIFANEVDEFQGYIKRNPTILGPKISIIAEQLDTGSRSRLDMLALEEIREGVVRPVIIELKNVEADIDVLLQVLRYANWALSNTDSIRLHAGESKAKFKELDNSNVKVIIVAPSIRDELPELSNYIVESIEFGFLEVRRFRDSSGDLVVTDWKTPALPPNSSTMVQKEWNWGKFETELKISPERIKIAKHLFDGLMDLNSDKGWGLTPYFRKYYVAFKKSGYNIVEIDLYTKPCYLGVQLSKQPKKLGLPEIHPELEPFYSEEYRRQWFKIPNTDIAVADFCDYIDKALENH